MLFLFVTMAHKLILWKTLLTLLDPGNMQQILSLACTLGESTVKEEEEVLIVWFCFGVEEKERKKVFLTNYLRA